jgi:Helicase associated domain
MFDWIWKTFLAGEVPHTPGPVQDASPTMEVETQAVPLAAAATDQASVNLVDQSLSEPEKVTGDARALREQQGEGKATDQDLAAPGSRSSIVASTGHSNPSDGTAPPHLSGPKPSIVSGEFDEMFDRLVAFREEHGHCRVPRVYKKDEALSTWAAKMRRISRKASVRDANRTSSRTSSDSADDTPTLTALQIERLKDVGFEWRTRVRRSKSAASKKSTKAKAQAKVTGP